MQRAVLTSLIGLAVALASACADNDGEPPLPPVEDVAFDAGARPSGPQPSHVDAHLAPSDELGVVTTRDRCNTDCDHDGLDDCQEAELGTDQCRTDSDRDGLSDKQEVDLGTDPLDPDTDSDGADDGEEVDLELDPTRRSTFDDGKDDGLRWIVDACVPVTTDDVQYYTSDSGNWTFGLSHAFDAYRALVLDREYAADFHAAAYYADSASDIAGTLVSHRAWNNSPSDNVSRTMTRALDILELDEPSFRSQISRFETHDGFRAASQTLILEPDTAVSPQHLRDSLVYRVLPSYLLPPALPTPTDTPTSRLRLTTTYVHRPLEQSPNQAVMNVAIVPEATHVASRRVRRQMLDATNTTNLALYDRGVRPGCAREPANERPKADFYWVVDQSRSMEDDFAAVSTFASRFFDILAASGMDYRLGVATMERAALGSIRTDTGWHTDRATFMGEIAAITEDPYGADGAFHDDDEYGLAMALEGLSYMLGLNEEVPQQNVRLRPDAEVVTLFVADEEPEAFQQYPLGTPAGQRLLDDYTSFFGRYSTVYALTTSDSWGYRQLAFETGGAYAPMHGEDTTASIESFVTRAVAEASTYRLVDTPITASMRVFKNGRWVPPSRENGYAYFPETNSIVFFGRYRPEPRSEGGRGDFVAVHYKTFTNPPKP
jgi:hypothetical protein